VRRGRVSIAAVAVVLLGLVFAGSALACSCVPASPAESLARADAAIVGRLLAVEPRGAARAEYRYEALAVYRGREAIEPRSVVKVLGARGSAACGLPERIGARSGLFLARSRGRWSGSLCGLVSPRRLRAAARGPAASAAGSTAAGCAG
jgi:hypothetical protein